MAIAPEKLRGLLESYFQDSIIDIRDTVGDQDHYEVTITSPKFAGLSKIHQHKMVMEALGGIVGTTLHALSIKTHTPS